MHSYTQELQLCELFDRQLDSFQHDIKISLCHDPKLAFVSSAKLFKKKMKNNWQTNTNIAVAYVTSPVSDHFHSNSIAAQAEHHYEWCGVCFAEQGLD